MNIKRIGLIGGNGVPVGGSSGTGSSTTVVDNLDSISKSAALSANMGRELNETKAPKVGYAPDLKVSYAEELVGRGDSTDNIIASIRPTSGKETSIKDGNATIERIKGESVIWNQLLSENKFNPSEAIIETDGDYYKITPLHPTANRFQQKRNVIKGHIYLQTAIVYNTSNVNTKFQNYLGLIIIKSSSNTNSSVPTLIWGIEKATETIDSYIQITNTNTLDSFWIKKNSFFLYDLTLMFGAGNEPTTIEEFEARKPLGVTNEYNEGTIVSFQGGDIKSVGFNAFTAKNSEVGSINTTTGLNTPFDRFKRSDFLPCIGNVQYEFIKTLHLYEYDTNRNFIKHTYLGNVADQPINKIITLQDKTHYIRVVYPKENESGVCIHLIHSGYRNGDYEPYVEDIHPLPDIKSIKDNNGDVLFPCGLLSAGSVHDEITATKAIKRIGVVNMETLDWIYDSTNTRFRNLGQLDNIKVIIDRNVVPNLLSPKYKIVTTNDFDENKTDKSIRVNNVDGYQWIYCRDTNYTSPIDFKQAMQGVMLYYELAEPIKVDLEEPLNMTYEAWDFGTEELISNDTTSPLNADIVYLFNAVDRIRENSKHVEENEKKLTKLQFHVDEHSSDNIELLSNGNLKLTLKGITKEFMPATPSGDPMHYAYETAGAEYNATTDFIVKDAPWKDMVDTIEDKAKWGFDVVDVSQVKQMTIGGTTYNYVQTTRESPEGTTEPRYFLVGQASDGTWVEDETKVLHLPGHWYLNGLGDITRKELALIYENYHIVKDLIRLRTLQTVNIRTFFPLKNSTWYSQFNTSTLQGFYHSKRIEAVCILEKSILYNTKYPDDRAPSIDDEYGFVNNLVLKYLPQHRITKTNAQTYKSATKLHVVPVVASQVSLYFSDIIQVSKNSILYVINNAVPTTPITITLHTDRYAQLVEDADIIVALEAKNTALEGTGGSISLVSA